MLPSDSLTVACPDWLWPSMAHWLRLLISNPCVGPSQIHLRWYLVSDTIPDSQLNCLKSAMNEIKWQIQDFPEEGTPTIKVGAPTYYFAKFSQKLHETKKKIDLDQ